MRPHAAATLYASDPYLALLESRGPIAAQSRYSFLCAQPFFAFRSKRATCFAGPPEDLRALPGDPLAELSQLLESFRDGEPAWHDGLPPLLGGAVGYLAYELLYLLEDIPDVGRDDLDLPDSYLVFYDTVLAFDALREKSWLVTTGFGASSAEAEREARVLSAKGLARLATLPAAAATASTERVAASHDTPSARARLTEADLLSLGVRPTLARADYLALVRTAKERIFAGDVFEICTTNRFDTELTGSAADLYGVLSDVNQAPFSAYLRFPEVEVLSSSPERYLQLARDKWAETRPIKGTRPRGATPEEDARVLADLETAEKDHAENVMVVDVSRNDLGRVCEFGTVTVPELCVVETYPFTHQLVSTVRGRLREQHDAVALVSATFPGASMTGAPKIEAMKIIDQLEPVKRGIYSGCVGYFDFDGSFDLSIVIRTFVHPRPGNRLTFHVGGAIVADSDPEQEYQETLDKAHGLATALARARSRAGSRS